MNQRLIYFLTNSKEIPRDYRVSISSTGMNFSNCTLVIDKTLYNSEKESIDLFIAVRTDKTTIIRFCKKDNLKNIYCNEFNKRLNKTRGSISFVRMRLLEQFLRECRCNK